MDYEELKFNFCNLLCQISINDLEQFLKWIDKHIQGYNKYGLNYIKSFTSEFREKNNNNQNKITNQLNKSKINCECGRSYAVNVTINQDNTTTTTSALGNNLINNSIANSNSDLNQQNKLKRISSTKLININNNNNNNNKKFKFMSTNASANENNKLNKQLKQQIDISNQQQQQQQQIINKDQQLFECSFCHKKYDNIQNAGSHILKCQHLNNQQQVYTHSSSSSSSSSSSLSLEKDENNNDIITQQDQQQQQQQNDNKIEEGDALNTDDDEDGIDDDDEYHNDINEFDTNTNQQQLLTASQIEQQQQPQQHSHQLTNLTLTQSLNVPLSIQTPTIVKQQTSSEFNKIKCPICAKPYSSNHTMLRHKMSIHDKLIKYCCKICDRSFFRKDKLATHISNHQDYDTYVCFICSCKVKSKHILKTHLKKDHNIIGDEANYNDIILKCQLKETIDIDSNMIINYGDAGLQPSPSTASAVSSSSLYPITNQTAIAGSTVAVAATTTSEVNNLIETNSVDLISKHDENISINTTSVATPASSSPTSTTTTTTATTTTPTNDDTINLLRNRKSLVYDMLTTQFDSTSNVDPL